MGQTRSIIIGLALVLGQTAAAYAADLGLPEPEPCVGCSGPWYVKGFVGAANPHVGGIDYELITPDFVTYDKDIKSTPLFGLGFGYDTGHYFRFDLTGEYRGDAAFFFHDKYPGVDGPSTSVRALAPTNTRPTSRAGSASSTPISISAPGGASRPMSAAASASPRCPSWATRTSNVPNNGVAFGQDNSETQFRLGRLCRPVLQGEPVAHPRSVLSLYRSWRYQDGQHRHVRPYGEPRVASRSKTSPPTISCFPCAWLWVASQRRCRSPLNKSPSTIDC